MTKKFSIRVLVNMWHTLALVPYAIIISISLWSKTALNNGITKEMLISRHGICAIVLLLLYLFFSKIKKIKTPVYPIAAGLHAITIYLLILSWNESIILAAVAMLLSTLLVVAYKKNPANDKPSGNDWSQWFANNEFRSAAVILSPLYAILFIAIVISYKNKGNEIWHPYSAIFATIIFTASAIELIRAIYIAGGFYKKHWIAIVDDQYRVIGGVNTDGNRWCTNEYTHVAVRIHVQYNDNTYLRKIKHPAGYYTNDTPFTAILRYKESYEECLARATNGIPNPQSLYFITKYQYSNVHEKRVVFLYTYDIKNRDFTSPYPDGSFWSREKIKNAKPGEVSEILRAESEFLDNITGDIPL